MHMLSMAILGTVLQTGVMARGLSPQSAAVAERTDSPALRAGAAEPSIAGFRPSSHGFAFVNSFTGSPLPVSLGRLGHGLNVPQRYGLCGGMSFAAADFYLAGRSLRDEIPHRSPPEQGEALYDYLYARQTASLGPMAIMATRFLEWMGLPEEGPDGTHARTLAELAGIEAAIARGEPVLIGLVFVSAAGPGAVWNNHQVLVYGCTRPSPDAPPVLRIYDPNYPDHDGVTIRWRESDDSAHTGRWERHVPRENGPAQVKRVRGFFRMPYTPSEPPVFDHGADAAAPKDADAQEAGEPL